MHCWRLLRNLEDSLISVFTSDSYQVTYREYPLAAQCCADSILLYIMQGKNSYVAHIVLFSSFVAHEFIGCASSFPLFLTCTWID